MAAQHIIPETFRIRQKDATDHTWDRGQYITSEPYRKAFLTTRKEGDDMKSWVGWGDDKYPVEKHDNVPLTGYRVYSLTKRSSEWFGSGRHVWRIQHPKGFVFEITSENMASIISHTTVSEGEIMVSCILAWQGSTLALIPTNSELYQKAIEDTVTRNKDKIDLKDLKPGDIVVTDKGDKCWYVGKHARAKFTHKQIPTDSRAPSKASLKSSVLKPVSIYVSEDYISSATTVKAVQVIGFKEVPEFDLLRDKLIRYGRLLVKDVDSLIVFVTEVEKKIDRWFERKEYGQINWENGRFEKIEPDTIIGYEGSFGDFIYTKTDEGYLQVYNSVTVRVNSIEERDSYVAKTQKLMYMVDGIQREWQSND